MQLGSGALGGGRGGAQIRARHAARCAPICSSQQPQPQQQRTKGRRHNVGVGLAGPLCKNAKASGLAAEAVAAAGVAPRALAAGQAQEAEAPKQATCAGRIKRVLRSKRCQGSNRGSLSSPWSLPLLWPARLPPYPPPLMRGCHAECHM